MKKYIYTVSKLILFSFIFSACNFLDQDPQNGFDPDQATEPEGFVTSAYAGLSNNRNAGLWSWGDVRSDDAYKGGGGTTDGYEEHCYEISTDIKTTFGGPDGYWFNMYSNISRVNNALKVLNSVSETDFPMKATRIAEMKFLRGYFYFNLKIMFKNVPYIDEYLPEEEYETVPNTALENDVLWAKIIEDFQYATAHLPVKHTNKNSEVEVGRVNKYAAAAFTAKAYLYKAFRQDIKNNVIEINTDDLKKVLLYTDTVMTSSYALETDFGFNFLPGGYENGPESLFAIQFSKDDGTMFGRLNWADFLSVPQGLGCCDFHKPSQNLVNAFKTSNGLPMFDDYNKINYNKNADMVDPRLLHTVAMPGLPYKYNESLIFQESWNRYPSLYGVYASLKENVDPSCDCFVNVSPYYANTKNKILIRFADVLLIRAEALIELSRETEALPLINEVRARAERSATGLVNYAGNYSVTFKVDTYKNGVNCTWSNDFARNALRWERRLEFAMENSRFFDLARWGVAADVMNEYYKTEASRRTYYSGALFMKNKNEYVPIPQQQIGYSRGVYEQNYGWD